MARPKGSSKYGAEIVERICAEIAVGKSMREICRAADMPDMRTVFRWLAAHSEFQQVYAQAREAQADYLAEEILEIADKSPKNVSSTRALADDLDVYAIH